MRQLLLISLATFFLSVPAVHAQAPSPLQTYKDWTAYAYSGAGKKICFATTEPKSREPRNAVRSRIVFYVSIWPGDGVRNEVSIKIGYPFKANSTVTVEVGTDKFQLFTQKDKAFLADPAGERRLIEAMKRGNVMVVKGVSQRGTLTTDRYSLSGISAALDRIAKECP